MIQLIFILLLYIVNPYLAFGLVAIEAMWLLLRIIGFMYKNYHVNHGGV